MQWLGGGSSGARWTWQCGASVGGRKAKMGKGKPVRCDDKVLRCNGVVVEAAVQGGHGSVELGWVEEKQKWGKGRECKKRSTVYMISSAGCIEQKQKRGKGRECRKRSTVHMISSARCM